ncbi:PhzF family phenazine biosynthesis protein [Acuticoccus mangrovi]|uniref:PhzF family phenazine biosynthesis protein n=1 Tax=Acuticoccus mangrovi TaxID=2796142 RepID=A0A934ILA9_9HYPH|nr:PhzF family phenazine biosynthesis protein [Acuticoccus mangrovi]MBJ3778608.1 PhzF family phenazine biosynthesis protein [Acuticoccus mangrovi]
MPYPYQILDVFTATPLAGNPLAVVFDADGIAPVRMQKIAQEFNLSETIFMLTPSDPAHTAAARIFTPAHELPFAGHPTVGGAVALSRRAAEALAMVTLELPGGLVRCAVTHDAAAGAAAFDAPILPSVVEGAPGMATLACALGLAEADIGFGSYRPCRATSGPGFTMVPVADVSALSRIALDRAALAEFGAGWQSVYVFAPKDAGGFQVRMFAPLGGIEEDPATGSAAVALAAVVMAAEALPDGLQSIAIAQGIEMGRPSAVTLCLEVEAGALARVELSGEAVLVAEGVFHA